MTAHDLVVAIKHEVGLVVGNGRAIALVERRDAEILEKCRSAIRAERAYQECLHRRVGSKYGAERREREIDAARELRARSAKELGL